MIGTQAGGAEHHVARYILHIPLAQHQPDAPRLQLGRNIPQLVFGLFIAGSYLRPRADQQPQQRAVGNTDADHSDLLPSQRCQILL